MLHEVFARAVTAAKAVMLAIAVMIAGCAPPGQALKAELTDVAAAAVSDRDFALEVCRLRIADAMSAPKLPGAPNYAANRAAILGRAVGEPVVFVREPAPPLDPPKQGEHPATRIRRLLRSHRFDKPGLRSRLLRDGYVYASDPRQAHALVRALRLQDLFDAQEIFLQRGDVLHRLTKRRARYERGSEYQHADGDAAGQLAKIFFADRVALTRTALAHPLHRDVRALRQRVGFERIRVHTRSAHALVAELRFGQQWYRALLSSRGARLDLECIDANEAQRGAVSAAAAANESRRRSVAALQASANALVAERLPFDRPRQAEDHFSDGQLRSQWEWAYRRGAFSFGHDEQGYLVFDRAGNAFPPQTCVEMVVDTFERASGNWYRKQGEVRTRTRGLNFSDYGIKSRNGVLAFETFAESTPELFSHRRLPKDQRVPFRDREQFFSYLVAHADAFTAGDIVAIQGLKRDGRIHQHAILITDTDPVTGIPYALTDQMKRPRRRSWEGIMAEAPLRSLLYHVRPTPALMAKLDPQANPSASQSRF